MKYPKNVFKLTEKIIYIRLISLLIAISMISTIVQISNFKVSADSANTNTNSNSSTSSDDTYTYSKALSDYKAANFESGSGTYSFGITTIQTDTNVSQKITVDSTEGVLLGDDNKWADFTVSVNANGLYNIGTNYYPYEGTGLTILRKVSVDGKVPFDEANNVPFYRNWKDEGKPVTNTAGDQVESRAIEVKNWSFTYFFDSQGKYSQPLEFYLTAGTHKIRLEYVDQPLLVSSLVISPLNNAGNYQSELKKLQNSGVQDAPTGFSERFEAETSLIGRSDPSAGLASDGDPLASPASTGYIKLNTYGGYSWRSGGQVATFRVEAPQDGLYKINVREKQNWGNGIPSYRKIEINGKVPFDEFNAYPFEFSRDWQSDVLGNKDGSYLVHLNKGNNDISMTAVLGSNTFTIEKCTDSLTSLSATIREIVMITGQSPDPNYDYDLQHAIPTLIGDMKDVVTKLKAAKQNVDSVSQKNSITSNNIYSIIKQLDEMINDPDTISHRMDDLNNMVTSLGDWIVSLQDQPLQIDYIQIASPDVKIINYKSNIFENTAATFQNFFLSFFKDYNAVASLNDKTGHKQVINVWIGRGTEWATILKNLADSEFTPATGISIKLNVLPSGQIATMGAVNPLMLAVSSGNAPDVAMSVPSNMPVEYAIRKAVVDLSKFNGFDAVTKQFLPQLKIPFEYNGGDYGIPETMYFRAMFYRKDIISELGIQLPQTWNDVYTKVLPKLYENGMQMNIPGWFDMFLLSNGGSFYTADGKSSALDTPQAYQAFKQYCENYTVYGAPVSANFFNRFRTGEMPIGLEGTGFYLQLIAAAPELMGKWAMAPIPGVMESNGQIDRSTAGYVGESDVIMSTSKKQQQSWEFIKWWTSKDVQTEYGRLVEGSIGTAARWSTSNVEAFKQLPWNKDDLNQIEASWSTVKEVPNVLGGYYTGRDLANAWNRCVIDGESPRDSLEQCVKDTNTELKRRQTQYANQ